MTVTSKDVVLLMFIIAPVTGTIVEQMYNVRKGYALIGGTAVLNITGLSMISCAQRCTSLCNSITYNSYLKTCLTFSDKIHETTIKWTTDPLWIVLYRKETISTVKYGNWTLVFRAQRDVNTSVSDSWLANETRDDNPVSRDYPLHCYRLDIFMNCPNHYRSYIIDDWSNITQVKFALYTNGTEVQYIVFNGTETTSINWFQQSTVLFSSWSSLKYDSIDDFSFESTTDLEKRRFVINSYNGCGGDMTYFQIIDTDFDSCMPDWLLTGASFPMFVYSPLDTLVLLSASPTAYRFADVMAVFVQ